MLLQELSLKDGARGSSALLFFDPLIALPRTQMPPSGSRRLRLHMGEQQGEGVPVPGRLKPTTQIFTSNSKTTTKTTQNAKPREAFWVKKKKKFEIGYCEQ